MSENFDKWLLTLGPDDLQRDLTSELKKFAGNQDELKLRLDAELSYLNLISARQVKLPNDLYFARAREKIFQKMTIKPVSLLSRLYAFFAESKLKTIPGIAAGAVLMVLLIFSLFNQPGFEQPTLSDNYERYVALGDVYTKNIVISDPISTSKPEIKQRLEFLMRSAAILSSPSSLSRSQSFGFSIK